MTIVNPALAIIVVLLVAWLIADGRAAGVVQLIIGVLVIVLLLRLLGIL